MRKPVSTSSAKAFLNFVLVSGETNGEARSTVSTVIRGDEKRSSKGSAAYRLSCLLGAKANALADELQPGEDEILLSGHDLMELLENNAMWLELRVRIPGDKEAEEPADDSWDF